MSRLLNHEPSHPSATNRGYLFTVMNEKFPPRLNALDQTGIATEAGRGNRTTS